MKLQVVLVVLTVEMVCGSRDVMTNLSIQFAKPLEACKKEMGLTETVLKDFYNFWIEDYEFTDRNTGCAILCMSKKLELMDGDYNLHHGKAHEFARKHGADETMAKQLVDLIHGCSQSVATMPDECERTLKVAKCFIAEIHKLKWAPDVELLMAEVLNEVSWKS
ncbi:pheromone-binding protein [Bombyx mori]|uniref:Pheromone binding protein 2 n=2 Tax=Bombyx mori TaxID=7091 RepID=A0A8R2C627_BOMMO|nr:pheromone-binding protein [Bombyx mori]